MADVTTAAAAAADPDPSLWGIGRLRDTAKWMIGAYAAVGAVLIAGLQLTTLGKVADDGRLTLAIVSAAAALGAVLVGIWAVARVLVPVEVSDGDVKREGQPTVTPPGEEANTLGLRFGGQAMDFDELKARYEAARTAFLRVRDEAGTGVGQAPEVALARQQMLELYEPLERLRHRALFTKVEGRFRVAQRWLLAASIVVAGGVITFAWAANPSDADNAKARAESDGPTLEQPSPVTLAVDARRPELDALRVALGDGCDLARVPALAIGGSAGHPEVVTEDGGGCHAVRFTVTSQAGFTLGTRIVPVSVAVKKG